MEKQKIISLAILTLAALGGIVISLNRLNSATVYAQSPTTQVQQATADDKETSDTQEKIEGVESSNEQAEDKNLPGSGHQDTNENVDHQFEGEE